MGIFNIFKTTAKTAAKSGSKTSSKVAASTRTNTFAKSSLRSAFKDQAENLARSKATSIAAKTVVIGGAAYAASSFADKGLNSLGYGIRGLTNDYTSQDLAKQDIQNKRDLMNLNDDLIKQQEDYLSWLNNNGYADSSDARQAYTDLTGMGGSSSNNDNKVEKDYKPWIYGGVALVALIGGAVLLSKKKVTKK